MRQWWGGITVTALVGLAMLAVLASIGKPPAAATAPAAVAAPRIAYVEVSRALNECAEAQKIREALKSNAVAKEAQIKAAEARAATMKGKPAQAEKKKAETLANALQEAFQKEQEEMQKTRVQPLLARVKAAAAQLGKERNLVVLFSDVLVYAPAGDDLTSEIIRRVDGK